MTTGEGADIDRGRVLAATTHDLEGLVRLCGCRGEQAAGNTVRQRVILKSGIDRDDAKKINNAVKESKLKVKTQIQDDQIRVTGKSRDDLQQVMQIVRELPLSVDVQFINFR